MTTDPTELHQQVWELLPWLANGTADAPQARLAEEHLRHCADCREALARERQLAAGMRLPADTAPSAELGLQRLMQRLDQAGPNSARPEARRPPRRSLNAAAAALVGVGMLELVALVALVAAGWSLSAGPSPQAQPAVYHTLSSPPAQAPGAQQAARLRLVYEGSRSVAELTALLQTQGLVVVAGPSAAGVWTLGLATDTVAGDADVDAVALRLRQSPGVRFAEALPPQAPAPSTTSQLAPSHGADRP